MKVVGALAFVLALSLAFAHEALFQNGYFDSRSGDVVIGDTTRDLEVFVESGGFGIGDVADTSFAGKLARGLGVPFSSAHASDGPSGVDIFKPRVNVNLLVVVEDGLQPSESASRVAASYLPHVSPIADLTTLLTGSTPSEHGIVSDVWYSDGGSREHHAYATSDTYALRTQIQESVAIINSRKASPGDMSFVVSASADKTLARGLGVHPSLLQQLHRANQHVASLSIDSENSNKFVEFGTGSRPISKLELGDAVESIRVRFAQHPFVVGNPKHAQVLLAELGIMFNIIGHIRSVRDSGVKVGKGLDFIAIGVSSLPRIKQEYGADSTEFDAANSLVRAAIKKAIQELVEIYGEDRVAHEVITFVSKDSDSSAANAATVQSVIGVVGSAAAVAVDTTYPSVYLLPSAIYDDTVRANIFSALCADESAAYCPLLKDLASSKAKRQSSPTPSAPSTPSTPTPQAPSPTPSAPSTGGPPVPAEVADMQVVLWSSILLVAIVIAAVYAFANLDVGDDSLLRSTVLPKHGKAN